MKKMKLILGGLFIVMIAAGCAGTDEKKDETQKWNVKKFYQEAKTYLSDGDFEKAIDLYEKLEARFPFGKYAQQAQLEIIYAYYKYDEPDAAIAAADRFIRINPRHANVDYAYYIKGLANFDRGAGAITRYLPIDASQRDPGATKDSFKDFSTMLRKYPNSQYAEDARLRMVYLRNRLAQYELHVADYYMRRGAFLAAANRAKYVVENFDKTPSLPDALLTLKQAYIKLELTELANDVEKVITHNYPNGISQKKGDDGLMTSIGFDG